MKFTLNFVNTILSCMGISLLLVGAGCGVLMTAETDATSGESAIVAPVPTVASFFQKGETIVLSSPLAKADLTVASPTIPARVALTPEPPRLAADSETPPTNQLTPQLTTTDEMIFTEIYGDEINENWTLWPDSNMIITATTTVAHSGRSSIAVTPKEDYSSLFFVVSPDAGERYPRDEVLGVSLWLNSGENRVELDDLALTVIGSNAYPYWVSGDRSVITSERSFFSETRLYYLGLNRPIPPNTWVELQVWLDDLPYDPDYQYVTGIYLKNDEGFRGTVYLDDLNLIRVKAGDSAEPVVASVEPVVANAGTVVASEEAEDEVMADESQCGSAPEGWVLYTIQAGDTLSGLTSNRKEMEEVMSVNCMEDTRIYTNQKLWLPALPVTTADSETAGTEEATATNNGDEYTQEQEPTNE